MSVIITELCINCNECVEECPATAIVEFEDAPIDAEHTYVKPEKCIECVDCSVPKCAYICPVEGAIIWDIPYIAEFNDYYMSGDADGKYKIRVHRVKGVFSPQNQPRPFRESISIEQRKNGMIVEI